MTVRYCIRCGREIGNERCCTNPDCGKIPNFYRDVPGPEHDGQSPGGESESRPDSKTAPVSVSSTSHSPLPDDDRVTVTMDTAPVAILQSISSPREAHAVLPGRLEIGARPPADVLINRPEISARHARITCQQNAEGRWALTVLDHHSTNGTFVNGERVEETSLTEGDQIRFANQEYVVHFPERTEPRHTMRL